VTEQSTRPEEQRRGGSTFRASTAEQIIVGGDVPGAVVVKMRNQWVMEDYSIVAKLKQEEEEERAPRVSGEDKPQGLVC